MLNRNQLIATATIVYKRHGTTMARAFLKALGAPIPRYTGRRKLKRGDVVSIETYKELTYCFQNTASPMDGRS